MTPDPSRPPSRIAASGTDDLYEKLDQLLSRHQTLVPRPAVRVSSLPTLTEAVDASDSHLDDLPVLHDAVEEDDSDRRAHEAAVQQRQLQAALYLRLRQKLDEQLTALSTMQQAQDEVLHFMRALRNALPDIVRTSVEQVFRSAESSDAGV
jgi:hypothetical protein